MKRSIPTFLLVLAASLQIVSAQTGGRYQLVRIVEPTRAQLDVVASLDCDHIHGESGDLVFALHESELPALRASGAEIRIEIEDMERYYAERARQEKHSLQKSAFDAVDAPEHFVLGSAGGFYTLQELDAQLDAMIAEYPQVATPFTIGTSTEGRPLRGIRISRRSENDATVPEVLYTAMHHAREPGGMMNLVYSMWSLLERHQSDPETGWLLENRALYFIPNLNPDGYNLNLEQNPDGGGMWRRNMRAQGDSGVDLNRNYGPFEYWNRNNEGSSEDPRSALYRGPAPFSEPETRAIRDFVLGRRFRIAINHHTFHNLLLWPFNWAIDPIADSTYYRVVTRQLARTSGYSPGNDLVNVGYSTRGVSDEWFYSFGNPGTPVISWTPESGSLDDGFWPLPSRIVPIAASSHEINMLAAAVAGAAPRVTAWERIDSGVDPMLRVTVTNIGREPMDRPAALRLNGENAVSIPILPRLGSITIDLPIPSSLTLAEEPRPEVLLRIIDSASEFGRKIRPMVHTLEMVMIESFEGAPSGWSLDGWNIEEIPGRGRVASDSPDGMYLAGVSDNVLQRSLPLSLEDLDAAELSFDARWVILSRGHEGAIEVRRTGSGGSEGWQRLDGDFLQIPFEQADTLRNRMRGDQGAWNRYRIDLDRYAGEQIELRFVLRAPIAEIDTTFDGIMLDNIAVMGTRSFSAVVADRGNSGAKQMRLYPNPFGDRLELRLENAGADTRITLVDALGRVVRRDKGTRITFDTRDLPAGLYTAIATTRQGVLYGKVMLVR